MQASKMFLEKADDIGSGSISLFFGREISAEFTSTILILLRWIIGCLLFDLQSATACCYRVVQAIDARPFRCAVRLEAVDENTGQL
jgi:hypothetical protein